MRLGRILNAWSNPPFWANPDAGIWVDLSVGEKEKIAHNFAGYVQQAYKANGVIFALILTRALVFSEGRFLWRRFEDGRPGDLYDNENLAILKRPWVNGTTSELLFSIEQDVSLAGNTYWVKVPADERGPERLRRLRPDWVQIVTGSPSDDPFDYRAQPVSYMYEPKTGKHREPVTFRPEQIVHYSPIPDPERQWLGMSWISPLVDEVNADKAATKHKLRYFERGTTGGLVVTYDKTVGKETFDKFKETFNAEHEGYSGAYKTFHIGGGSDIKTVGADLAQLEFKVTQGAGETRLAAAARVPPVIAGLSEGLQGSSLNTGNFSAARRLFADGWLRPAWGGAAAAFESILEPPEPGSALDYDPRDVAFLRDDSEQEALIREKDARTFKSLVESGWTPESAKAAVLAGDWSLLQHSGQLSVQLQDPLETSNPDEDDA